MGPIPRLWLFAAALAAVPASAQNQGLVVRDGTLGSAPEGVVPPGLDDLGQHADYLIRADLGEQRGGNLFHSFARFSIGSGEWATFTGQGAPDPGAIDNVISRVTGPDPSQIDGTLRSTIPGADVWLLNPSGVMFGAGAQLDVPGSFHASTGDYLGFGEGDLERFYGDPTRPSVLSTARPEAFGFLGESPAAPISLTGARLATVRVGDGLELVGGDVTLTSATLNAPGGEISIRGGRIVVEQGSRVLAESTGGSAAGTITVDASESLDVDGSLLSVTTRGAGNAGTIELTGGDVRFRNGPGANSFPTSVGAAADTLGRGAGGTIEIDAESLEVTEGARLSAETIGGGGAGGRLIVRVPAGSVRIASGGSLQVNSWFSRGNAGAIDITADSLTLDTLDPRTGQKLQTLITAWAYTNPSGPETPASGGTIDITARSVELRNGSAGGDIGTQCLHCTGGAGDITITATEKMRLDGHIFASTFFEASGDGGNITIDAGSLEIAPLGIVFAGTAKAQGDRTGPSGAPGNVTIHAGSLVIGAGGIVAAGAGEGSSDPTESGLAGSVTIDAGSLVIEPAEPGEPGGVVFAGTEKRSSRKAGDVTIDTGSLVIGSGGFVGASTGEESSGDGGNVTIDNARSLVIEPGAFVATSTGERSSGNAGNLTIRNAGSLVIEPGAFVAADAAAGSSGSAGTISIGADSVHIGPLPDEPLAPGPIPQSGIIANSFGRSGSITIGTAEDPLGSLVLAPGGLVVAGAYGASENAGSITIGSIEDPADSVVIAPGAFIEAHAETGSTAKGGTISISADSVHLGPHPDVPLAPGPIPISAISVNNEGAGAAGDITIDAGSLLIAPGGVIAAHAEPGSSGDAGNISIHADTVHVGPHADVPTAPGRLPLSVITASTEGAGAAGSVEVRATQSIFLTYEGGLRFDLEESLSRPPGEVDFFSGIVASTNVGGAEGGSITMSAPDVTVSHGAIVSTSTVGGGQAGDVSVTGSRILVTEGGSVNSLSVFNSATGTAGGDAGSVTLAATESIAVVGPNPVFGTSQVSSISLGSGAGGAVTLSAPLIRVDGGAVVATALPYRGLEGQRGGEISLNAGELLVREGGRVDASSFIAGDAGNIDIRGSESILVTGQGSFIASRTGASGRGGDVRLQAPRIELSDGGEVSARSEAVDLAEIFPLAGDTPDVATGPAGTVTLVADEVLLESGSLATNAEAADGGDITIQATQLVHLDAGEITASVTGGTGGNITIDPEVVMLENGSRIVAQAGEGTGGRIQITADNYFAFPGTVVDASSDLGIDGVVEIHAPDVDLAGKIATLPSTPLDAASLIRESCAARRSGERAGSFAVRGNGGIPSEPDGWLSAPVPSDREIRSAALDGGGPAWSGPGPLARNCE